LALLYGALAAAVLFLLGVVLYREIDRFLLENTASRLRAQAQATLDRHTGTAALPALAVRSLPVDSPAPDQPGAGGSVSDEIRREQVIFWRLPSVGDVAGAIVQEMTTRDTSALVLDTRGRIVVGGSPLAASSFTAGPPPAIPDQAGGDLIRGEAPPAVSIAVTPFAAAAPEPDQDRVRRVTETGREETYVKRAAGSSGRTLVALLPLRRQPDGAVIGALQVTTSLQAADALLARLRLLLLIGLGGALAVSLLVGLPLTRAALRPLDRLVATTERIAADQLSARSDLPHGADEIGRLAASFDRMLSRLQTGFTAQRQFVADAAHELRTPLTAVGGLIELLLLGADNEDGATRRRALVAVDKDLARLTRLINDLLALSRFDHDAAHQRRRLDLTPLVEDIRALTAELAADRSVTLERPDAPVLVIGDPDHLRQVLLNLAENARRYTTPGDRIAFRVGSADGSAEVAVINSGPGISPEHLPRIFDRFYRGDRARDRQTGGAGLGLPIARAIAEAHGGALTVESTPGQGAAFFLRLPLAPPPRGRRPAHRATSTIL
jgi:signal transduction histidine kinase